MGSLRGYHLFEEVQVFPKKSGKEAFQLVIEQKRQAFLLLVPVEANGNRRVWLERRDRQRHHHRTKFTSGHPGHPPIFKSTASSNP